MAYTLFDLAQQSLDGTQFLQLAVAYFIAGITDRKNAVCAWDRRCNKMFLTPSFDQTPTLPLALSTYIDIDVIHVMKWTSPLILHTGSRLM